MGSFEKLNRTSIAFLVNPNLIDFLCFISMVCMGIGDRDHIVQGIETASITEIGPLF